MAFSHGKNSQVWVDTHHLSAKISEYSTSWERDLSEVTCLLDGGQKFIPGLIESEVSLEGYFETDAINKSVHEILNETRNVDDGVHFTASPSTLAVGAPSFFAVADAESYEVDVSVDDAVSFSFEATGNGVTDWGHVLHAHNAVTATGQDTSVDNGAAFGATTGGGAALLHVTAKSGTSPNLVAKVQHSVDNSVWTDLITFTAATDITSEFKTVAGTVNRYVRAQYTITGTTPSFTFILAFARR